MENWESFVFDAGALAKSTPSEDALDAALDRRWNSFVEETELAAAGGRTGTDPHTRLRSEYVEPEPQFAKRGAHDVDHVLGKSGDRKKLMLKSWLASQLAVGESLEALVQHAERYDRPTANLLREIGAELTAA